MRDYLFHIFSHIHDVNKDIKWNCGHEIVWFFSEWCINVCFSDCCIDDFFLIDVSMIFFWLTYQCFFWLTYRWCFFDWRIDDFFLIDVSMIFSDWRIDDFFWLTYMDSKVSYMHVYITWKWSYLWKTSAKQKVMI